MKQAFEAISAERADIYKRCPVGRALRDLPPEDSDDLAAILEDSSINNKTITLLLRSLGFDCGSGAVQHHRRGDCRCPQPFNRARA